MRQSQLPKMLNIDRTDPFFVIRFLHSVYTNYLNHVNLKHSGIVTEIPDKSRAWKGGSAEEFKQHLGDIQAMMARLPPLLRSTWDRNLIMNMVTSISNLKDDPNLDALHTVICSKHNENTASVRFACIKLMIQLVASNRGDRPTARTEGWMRRVVQQFKLSGKMCSVMWMI
jgi:hypothetical protein